MNKVAVTQLLLQAKYQIREMSVHLIRAESNFFREKSIDLALQDLKKTQKMLELAKKNACEQPMDEKLR